MVIGNWKMNPSTVTDAKVLFRKICKGVTKKHASVDVMVAPPYPFLLAIAGLVRKTPVAIGAQHVHFEKTGRHTGEVSVSMLRSVGVSHVIIGHSERRAEGETDEQIRKTLFSVAKAGLYAVLCIGETKRDSSGSHFNVVEEQFAKAFTDFPRSLLGNVIIAYEPVWAISSGDGQGKTATPGDAHEMKLFIQKLISDRYGRPALKKVRILYGGSANAQNAEVLLKEGMVDGFLVGGASLKPKEFISMINTTQRHAETHTS